MPVYERDDLDQVRGIWLPKEDTHFRAAIELKGGYLPERLDAAMTYCVEKRCAVDVGAHIGLYTMQMMQEFDEVYAFEPAPDSYECLTRNTAGISGIVHLNNLALGNGSGVGELLADPLPKRQGNTGARYVVSNGRSSVLLRPLDDWQLSICDFLKIDVEGMELDVLQGAEETILRCRPVVMIEIGKVPEERYGRSEAAPLEWLQERGMDVALEMRADKVLIWQ